MRADPFAQTRTTPLTITELDNLMRALERLPTTGDFRFDQAIGLAHDRLLMMWAEARRAADTALDAANAPDEDGRPPWIGQQAKGPHR